MKNENNFRALPQLDALLKSEAAEKYLIKHTLSALKPALKKAIEDARAEIADGKAPKTHEEILKSADLVCSKKPQPQRVINASGIALHTNLGRAPLSDKAKNAILEACGYSNLEYSLEKGERASRGKEAERLICQITNAEDALCVNNNAAALLLAITALSKGKAAVISRGELVEIGGSFRIGEIIAASGAALMETGSTNRTHEADYARACESGGAGLILKIHTSNYKIEGFASDVSLEKVCSIAKKYSLPVVADLGSGALLKTSDYPFNEPCVPSALKDGADIVCFSGDKLLGGPQCGILCGKKELIESLRKHPLARALRVDKLCIAALCATLSEYSSAENAKAEIPVLQMLCESKDKSLKRAECFINTLTGICGADAQIIEVKRPVGGGSVPGHEQQGFAVAVNTKKPQQACAELLKAEVPVVAFVRDGRLIIDPLCFLNNDEELAARAVANVL